LLDQDRLRPQRGDGGVALRGMSAAPGPDLLVVGLGPAGACAAREAARAGLRVLAIDRRRDAGVPVQCAEFVPGMIGLPSGTLGRVSRQRIDSMVTFLEDQAPHLTESFPGHIIERQAFDRALVDDAIAAGAECRFGTALRSVGPDGAVTTAAGTTFRPKATVGADGPRSSVGRAVGRINRSLVETRQITVPLHERHGATDIFLSTEIYGGYGWLFPKGDVANLGLGVAPSAKARLKPLLAALHARLIAEGRVGAHILATTGGAIPVGGMIEPHGQLGTVPVVLAGDAAGLTNPVTGAGIDAAVRSGAMAGAAIVERLAGAADALANYAEELAELFESTLDRALRRRQELLAAGAEAAAVTPAAMRRGWIAYPEYWAA
jgi:digeranylgeranylglycerophospholipid reductase